MIVGGIHKAQEAVQRATSKDKKIVDLERDTANIHTKQPLTTDHGMRVENTDQWLRIADDKHTGPSLLEDQIAREKVLLSDQRPIQNQIDTIYRSPASTTNASQNGSSMPAEQVLLETSNSTRVSRISHMQVS